MAAHIKGGKHTMTNTTEYVEKIEALKAHLIENENFTEEEAEAISYDSRFDSFECGSWEYKVYTEEEADKAAREEILETLWAFNPEFILYHTDFYNHSTDREDDEFVAGLSKLQSSLCESANSIIKALIVDLDRFVSQAIREDGRGHFLSQYDGEEVESGDFYLYRIN
jgi:hypothetical protein